MIVRRTSTENLETSVGLSSVRTNSLFDKKNPARFFNLAGIESILKKKLTQYFIYKTCCIFECNGRVYFKS